METMFDTLLQLPLFQGLRYEDFYNIIDKVKLHFVKHKAGEYIIKEGSTADRLCFLLKGDVYMETPAIDNSYTVAERISAPFLIEPQALFGLNTVYASSYVAIEGTQTVSISKEYLLSNLLKYEVFCLNYLNIISTRIQHQTARLWQTQTGGVRGQLIHFLALHSERLQGEKILRTRIIDLARILNVSRITASRMLYKMRDEGLIELHRKSIVIPDLQKLL